MHLLSQKHFEYKGKPYFKYWVIIPNLIIKKLGWKMGDDLEVEIKGDKVIIKKD
ncbi:MAG: AbrB/MazE/SpoVT family DNA-binding domain-containing protein [Nanoarchaeota archaeon]